VFTPEPTSLLQSNKVYALFYGVCFRRIKLQHQHISEIDRVPLKSSDSPLSWSFLLAHSKTKLKSNGVKASPCFRPFRVGNVSDRCLPVSFTM
jgi:hypothetical protein